jgi:hypothetical protein
MNLEMLFLYWAEEDALPTVGYSLSGSASGLPKAFNLIYRHIQFGVIALNSASEK